MSLPNKKRQTASNIDSYIDLYVIDERGENIFDPSYQKK